MEHKEIRMVALDLDGTTLNSRGEISARTAKAFLNAMEKGVHIVISTGRTYQSLPGQLFSIKGLEYVITSNGAHITRLKDGELIYENNLAPEAVLTVVEKIRGAGMSVETFVGGRAYIDKAEFDQVAAHGSDYRDAKYILTTRNPVVGICDFMIENREKIENISLNFPDLTDKGRWYKALSALPGITVTSSFIHNLEIGGADTNKGRALEILMEQLSVQHCELMACGDSLNDQRMLQLAGIGVAVDNASEEIKAIADYVTANNNDDGVAKAIEKFVL
ncbi:Cof-type HAD-IIB family hydrolase [Ihubacter sp. mB4P-1]|uniref:Cof-type HAD-IIB family hydrolase n=1 Tax=Ihubacter sp. mB4P-1 TaxID=3242370 RepID=UPI00137B07C0